MQDWEIDDIKCRRPSQPASGPRRWSRRKPPNAPTLSPQKRGVAPMRLKMCKAARPTASGPNAKRLPNRPRPAAGRPGGHQSGQVLGLLRRLGGGSTERGHENQGLVGAFCPRMSERYCCPENGLKLVSAKGDGGGAPLLALTADRASIQVPTNRNTIIGLMALRLTPKW